MKTEKGVIIAAYKQERNPRFVVLHRTKNWEGWELPKGHLEQDNYEKTVRTELEEEAGIEAEKVDQLIDLGHTVEWKFKDNSELIRREYRAFLVKLSKDAVIDTTENPHNEHSKGFFARKEDAKSLLTYENNVEVLEEAFSKIKD